MSKVVMVTVATVDSSIITRSPEGFPRVDGQTRQSRLYLATEHDDGWLLETWRADGSEYEAGQQVELTDTDSMAANVADALRAIAVGKD